MIKKNICRARVEEGENEEIQIDGHTVTFKFEDQIVEYNNDNRQ